MAEVTCPLQTYQITGIISSRIIQYTLNYFEHATFGVPINGCHGYISVLYLCNYKLMIKLGMCLSLWLQVKQAITLLIANFEQFL